MVLSPSFPRLGCHVWQPTFIGLFFPITQCSPGLRGWTMFSPSTSPPMSLFLAPPSTHSGLLTLTPLILLTTGFTPFHQKFSSPILGFPFLSWETSTSTTPSQTLCRTSRTGKSRPQLPTLRKPQNQVSHSIIPQVSTQGFPWWATLALRS